MSLGLGPWQVEFPVRFWSGGDTTREAFGKHIEEIKTIYGILNAINAAAVTSDSLDGTLGSLDASLKAHIDSTNPHPNWKPSLSFDDITGDLDASRVHGELTNATIDASRVNNLKSFIKDNAPDKGDGITKSNNSENGYVKFGNGLIIQWGHSFVDSISEKTYDINFPVAFSSSCFNVTAGTYMNTFSDVVSLVPQVVKKTLTNFTFGIQFFHGTPGEIGSFSGKYGVSYIATGI